MHREGWAALPRIAHRAVSLVQQFAVGYYHFILDVLPRLLLAKRRDPDIFAIVPADDGA